jgi:ribonuclease T
MLLRGKNVKHQKETTVSAKEVYISVDIETSGPIPDQYSMLSIGACEVGASNRNFYVEIRPTSQRFEQSAMKIVGRSLADFTKTGVEPPDAMRALRDWVLEISGDRQPVFVAFNAVFDWSFINWYFHTYLKHNPFGIAGIDIKSYYMALTSCRWSDTRLSRIEKGYKSNLEHTHNALDDAIQQAEMFELMRTRSLDAR